MHSSLRIRNAFGVAIVLLALQQLLLWNASTTTTAFTMPPPLRRTTTTTTTADSTSHSAVLLSPRLLKMTNFFDDIGKFFDEMMSGNKNKPNDNSSYNKADDDDKDNDNDDDDDGYYYAGSTRLLSIPVESIKPGGLRLFLMFYLMGMQNTPAPGSWRADTQPSKEVYVLDMYYQDRTGALTLTLSEKQITIDRIGSTPSTSYLMQESVIINGILEELQECATQNDVAEKDRLLLLPEPQDAIEKARDSLAFR
jgi:hypothetical protein